MNRRRPRFADDRVVRRYARGATDIGGLVYFVFVLATTVVAPLVSGFIHGTAADWADGPLFYFGLWWVFWGIGVRLFAAGISQIARPRFTSKNILGIDAPQADQVVQELGFANTAIGAAGLVSGLVPAWAPAIGFVGGVFLVLAALRHTPKMNKNAKEWTALLTDYLVGIIALAFAITSLLTAG
ncbi:hypothetical protein [Microbacterium yannicii]|uniref:hypothetical protein n=1 Tax=Microbacterium yannicii TaxID=671622 RepID=UPI0003829EFD|nr:hypothetical protein [Microbacterium yannicii]